MNVVMIAPNDPAGTCMHFKRAVERLTPHRVRVVSWERKYQCGFPTDLHAPTGEFSAPWLQSVLDAFSAADVLHFVMPSVLPAAYPVWSDKLKAGAKAVVWHHHGEQHFRQNLPVFIARYTVERPHDPVLVSTPDMLRLFPPGRATWVPNCIPLDDPEYAPAPIRERERGDPLRVCHSPTRRELKGTDRLIAAVERLKWEGVSVELDIVENVSRREVLDRKRAADVVFDQMGYSYGMSSLEAMAVGRAAIIGKMPSFDARAFTDFAEESSPFFEVETDVGLCIILRYLATRYEPDTLTLDPRLYDAAPWMRRHWTEAKCVAPLIAAWERALADERCRL